MAPSIHMIRVDVDTEISPMVGGEEQSKELIEYLGGQEPEKLWQSNIFGKSVYDLIQEGLNAKLLRLPGGCAHQIPGNPGPHCQRRGHGTGLPDSMILDIGGKQ